MPRCWNEEARCGSFLLWETRKEIPSREYNFSYSLPFMQVFPTPKWNLYIILAFLMTWYFCCKDEQQKIYFLMNYPLLIFMQTFIRHLNCKMELLFWKTLSDLHSSISHKYVYISISISLSLYKIRVNTELEKQAVFPEPLLGLCGRVLVVEGLQEWVPWEAARSFPRVRCQCQPAPRQTHFWPVLSPSAMGGAPLW